MIARAARWAVAALAATVAVASCDEPRPTQGRVEGVVRAGPTCPVEQEGQPCLPLAVSGEVRAEKDGEVKASTRTDPTGHFEIAAAGGGYVLTVDVGGPFPACPPTPVEVRAMATVSVDIDCDTGIR